MALKHQGEVHPFKRYKEGNSGQRMHLVMSRVSPHGDHEQLGAWECMLWWWSENPKTGMQVSMRLDNGPDGAASHPLEGMQKGDELYMAMWLLGDDENLVPPQHIPRRKGGWDKMRPAQQAHTLCGDAEFHQWCAREARRLGLAMDMDAATVCIEVIRVRCGITSRAELGEDTHHGVGARRKWAATVQEYWQWRG